MKKNYTGMLLVISVFAGTMAQANVVNLTPTKYAPTTNYQQPIQASVQTTVQVPETSVQAPINLPSYKNNASTNVQTKQTSLAEDKTTTELSQTVEKIGNKILKANNINETVNFKLVNENKVNAYTNGENTVSVYTGLLKKCQSQDELAFIIGHEIGHAIKNHVIKTVVINNTVNTVAGIGESILNSKIASTSFGRTMSSWGFGGLVSSTTSLAVDTVSKAATAKINRGQEDDADIIGIDLVVKAGYDPIAGINIIKRIGDNYNDFFQAHTSTEKRIATMSDYVEENYPQYVEEKASFLY